ncbi:HNH endonuclease signature motif containing protein [Mycobacterium sp. E740]|uniref:HNH endonuclease signature motif containing protein n=1 Tax=Mycobacterium sp. E740 TaxID=1834149 RepID=UPI000AB10336|nr:HNH endonuclease signature motif containing protein [Mycobacterium sp. E740]
MFETVADAEVVEAITSAWRDQNAACGREMLAIGELYARHIPDDGDERDTWAIDGHANVVAEISAALNISRGRAAGRLNYAIDLRERLPRVGAAFAAGDIDFRMMAALVSRSQNVEDPDRLARLDEAFAKWAPTWMKMSGPKLTDRVDMWVEKIDPAGVREPTPSRDDRYVDVGPLGAGMAGIWAKVSFAEGITFDTRVDEIAATVCSDDPRTIRQRRVDALMAMADGQRALVCGCADEHCPAQSGQPVMPGQVVISVVADEATLDGRADNPGYAPGFGPVPAPLLRDLVATATLRPVRLPMPCAEAAYRPSAALARFVRCRDLTCRFPGCEAPAAVCQIDHTIPYPVGPTHPSNLKLLCVFHHLLKTFWSGGGGWSDRQLPDGTVIWTSPSTQTYETKPAGAQFFPQLATPTGEIILPSAGAAMSTRREAKMPKRRCTRAQDKAYRIGQEREHNTARLARKEFLLCERIARNNDPPPF